MDNIFVEFSSHYTGNSGEFGGDFGFGYASMSFGPTALQSPAKNSTEILEFW